MGTATKTNWADVFDAADAAGRAAAEACVPVPMVVTEHANPLDDNSAVVRRYAPIADGVCGYAWVTIRPANCAAANHAKKNLRAQTTYGGGMQIWVSQYGQSMTKKMAYAQAFADVLQTAGVKAYSDSRMN